MVAVPHSWCTGNGNLIRAARGQNSSNSKRMHGKTTTGIRSQLPGSVLLITPGYDKGAIMKKNRNGYLNPFH